jgi:hypothetical protein
MSSSPPDSNRSFRLIVEPMCGLCNRLRVLDGAVSLAARYSGTVEVFWFSDADLNCRFTNLFEPLPDLVRFRYFSLPPLIETGFKRVVHAVMKRTCQRYLLAHEVEYLEKVGHDFSDLAAHRRVFLKTWSRFYPTAAPFAIFRPASPIQAIIDRQGADPDQTVGVHIRRTDAASITAASPTRRFIARMEYELRENPQTRFFLATDDPTEEELMKRTFPGRIQTYSKRTRSRNQREGIEDAVVDLFCLARCRKILGSYKSSFSETAIALSQREGVFVC